MGFQDAECRIGAINQSNLRRSRQAQIDRFGAGEYVAKFE
jgi:hypothetical protein